MSERIGHKAVRRPSAGRGALALTVCLACALALGLSGRTARAQVTAEAVLPITLTANESLRFGNIFASAVGGSVTIAANNTPSRTGSNVTLVASDFGAAEFDVTGDGFAAVTITLPATIVLESGAFSMNASLSVDPGPNVTIGARGSRRFWVGATLTVGADQPAGNYIGIYSVTVAYD